MNKVLRGLVGAAAATLAMTVAAVVVAGPAQASCVRTVDIEGFISLEGDPAGSLMKQPFTFVVASTGCAAAGVVGYGTSDDGGVAGTDYDASFGTLTFAAGDLSEQTITVPVNRDTDVEADERFRVYLCHPTDTVTPGSVGVGVIRNDDFTSTAPVPGHSTPIAATAQPNGYGCGR